MRRTARIGFITAEPSVEADILHLGSVPVNHFQGAILDVQPETRHT
jgi:hypothetical protein